MKKIVFLISVFAVAFSFQTFAQNSKTTDSAMQKEAVVVKDLEDSGAPSTNPLAGVTNIIDKATKTSATLKQRNELVNTLMGANKPTSLMFDDDEKENVNRAVDSFKSGQSYVAEGEEEDLDSQSKKDQDAAKAALDKAKQDQEENAKSYIYLASILYTNNKNWTIWISGNKITSSDNDAKKELYVKSINPEEVKMRWTLSISKWKILSGKIDEALAPKINENNQVEVNFTLRPNQTFVLNAYQVVEGHLAPKAPTANPNTTTALPAGVKTSVSSTASTISVPSPMIVLPSATSK